MNTFESQPVNNEPQCCVDYCQTSFQTEGKEIVNNYKCDEQQLSAPEVWNMLKNRKQTAITGTIHVN